MSYDIGIRINHPDGYSTHVDVGNFTSNVATMMRAACGVSFPWFDGMTTKQALPIARHAWAMLKRNPDWFRMFEPDNDWGTYDEFMPYLTRFYVLTRLHPTGRIEVSW